MIPLPFDVQEVVLHWVYRLTQSSNIDYATLSASALVCRSWTPTAQRLLFRRIPSTIFRHGRPHPISMSVLLHTLWHNLSLSAHVRTIIFDIYPDSVEDKNKTDDRVALLSLCPNIAAIHIGPGEALSWWATASEHIAGLGLRPVVLSVFRGTAADASALLSLWPSVRYFSAVSLQYDAHEPPRPAPASLLGLQQRAARTGHQRYLPWVVGAGNGMPTLRSLELAREWPRHPPPARTMAHLRTLTVWGVPPARVLDALTHLEELVVQYHLSSDPDALLSLPRSLQHFGFHESGSIHTAAGAVQLLQLALAPLPVLQLVTATRFSSKSVLSMLEAVSKALGVDFVVFPNSEAFPRPKYVDWT